MKQTEKDHSSSGGRLACFARLADSKDLFVGTNASIVKKRNKQAKKKRRRKKHEYLVIHLKYFL